MDFTKLSAKSAAKLGFLIGLASPVMLFSPEKIDFQKTKIQKNGLTVDEQKVAADYGYEEVYCGK